MCPKSIVDTLICEFDTALRTIFTPLKRQSARGTPGRGLPEAALNDEERRHVAGLMRVNHAGEVSAQALYQGQALTAQLTEVKAQMTQAAIDEVDHLAWCEQRLQELNSKPSVLNPLWYTGSLFLGAIAGLFGDKWSLGFVAETERQVTNHLEKHLAELPSQDKKSRAILMKMKSDETKHAHLAVAAGAADLPSGVKHLMQGVSALLTYSCYYL
ncbi:MAG: 2-polyprenyl-3-methyl-6-methoxy-1,4-benzoquinone monooxygenase [Legionellales bacterium]|nr:2-polyprenyl-3-methyl-6-methoxy-1,4-benzoquinone monooxygenase [Legionellales bacterium]